MRFQLYISFAGIAQLTQCSWVNFPFTENSTTASFRPSLGLLRYTQEWPWIKSKSHYDQQSVRLGVKRPSGTRDQFFFLLEILFRQLRVCYFVVPSLTRGRVCNLELLLVLASAVPFGLPLYERSGLSFVSISL
jgi:hypothetical protein